MDTIPIEEYRLDNGLRVVLSQDHLVPVVGVNLWYAVGSMHEEPGRTGLAHLFEHMMFQGSTNVAKAEHVQRVEVIGGRSNATTSLHRTNYFEVAPSHALELLLWLEADRMGGLLDAVGQETLDNQRDVVKNEKRQRVDNQPYGDAFERMLAGAFPEGHPYHHTPIGSMADLDAADLDDVRAFFRAHYAPNNAVLTVAGDFEPVPVRSWIEREFGAIAAADVPPVPGVTTPLGGVGSREEVRARVPLPRIYAVFRAPGAGDRELHAAQMGAAVLAGTEVLASRSSRLHRRLVRDAGLGQDVVLQALTLPGTSMIILSMMVRPGADMAEAESAMAAVIEGLADEPPTDDELARARAGIERGLLDRLSSTFSRADLLSECATLYDDPGEAPRLVERALSVSAAEIVEAARRVFAPDNRHTLVYLPEAS